MFNNFVINVRNQKKPRSDLTHFLLENTCFSKIIYFPLENNAYLKPQQVIISVNDIMF